MIWFATTTSAASPSFPTSIQNVKWLFRRVPFYRVKINKRNPVLEQGILIRLVQYQHQKTQWPICNTENNELHPCWWIYGSSIQSANSRWGLDELKGAADALIQCQDYFGHLGEEDEDRAWKEKRRFTYKLILYRGRRKPRWRGAPGLWCQHGGDESSHMERDLPPAIYIFFPLRRAAPLVVIHFDRPTVRSGTWPPSRLIIPPAISPNGNNPATESLVTTISLYCSRRFILHAGHDSFLDMIRPIIELEQGHSSLQWVLSPFLAPIEGPGTCETILARRLLALPKKLGS